ncbi:hypothetical protein Lfu02_13570 [Longispora fulva]|nr:hypothetical protein Lfu02_13570 [Longispora fulva]
MSRRAAVGASADGQREVLSLNVTSMEDARAGWWFLRGFVSRRLGAVSQVIADARVSLIQAIVGPAGCRLAVMPHPLPAQPAHESPEVGAGVGREPGSHDLRPARCRDAQFGRVVDSIAEKFPAAAEQLDEARGDLLSFASSPERSG